MRSSSSYSCSLFLWVAALVALAGCADSPLPAAAIAPAANEPPVAAGNAARGQELYETRCVACHSLDENRVGPMHKGLFGRKAGSVPDYDYSPVVKAAKVVWGERTLNTWLTDPESLIPGQKMGYQVPDATDRADIIAYLKKATRP